MIPAEQAFGERVDANIRLLAKTLFAEFNSEQPLEPASWSPFRHQMVSCLAL